MKTSDHSLHHRTPTVAVRDNRGLAVRQIVYHRHPDTPADIDERITRHRFDAFGHPVESTDPRLPAPNFTYQLSMTGETLRTDSVDAGRSIALNDSAGRPLMHLSANDVFRYHHYESAPLAGRPLSVTESFAGATPRIAERFVWAGTDQASKDHNLAGLPVRHYDAAGRLGTDSVALTGLPLSSTRRLLKANDEADWQGADEAAWERLLAPETYTTLARADATGTLLEQTDARGHQQRLAHDIAGQLASSWLTVNGGSEQAILVSVAYSAAGQKLREEHGNGVVTTFTYEPRTQRLVHILAVRPADAKRLQDLRYAYDPVGNVLDLHNDAEATRFYRNQKVDPEHHYTYDTLYQLASATGRELLDIANRPTKQRSTTLPLPSADGTLVNYVRHYHYDRGGNLTGFNHNPGAGFNSYKIELTVSDRSNRAVSKDVTEDPSQVDGYFDAAGNQRQLQAAQQLDWTARGELARAVLVARDSLAADEETYRYDARSQRLVKRRSDLTAGTLRLSHALYLPGLELRTQYNDTTVESSRHEIIVGAAGSAQVRVLHWETGLPPGMANDSIRYSYTDLIGSIGLELDKDAEIISQEEYYPYGETAMWLPHNTVEAAYKTVRYSGKERDATGLYYYGYRYYQPWLGRWLSADPVGTVDGLNLYRMTHNNPITYKDMLGLTGTNLRRAEGVEDLSAVSSGSDMKIHALHALDKLKGFFIQGADRESMMTYFNAVEGAQDIFSSTREEALSFVDSKRQHIATRGGLNILTTLIASTYSGLISISSASILGGIGATALGTAASIAVKSSVGAPPPLPDTDMAKKINDQLLSTSEKVGGKIMELIDKKNVAGMLTNFSLNTGIGYLAAESGYSDSTPSFPFQGLFNNGVDIKKAMNTKKDDFLAELSQRISQARSILESFNEMFEDAFANTSRAVNYSAANDDWMIVSEGDHVGRERAIPTEKYGLPYLLTRTTYNGQYSMAVAHLDLLESTLNQAIAERGMRYTRQ
ncbi:RHS repeat-associated core domain-containing protein [Pseudomonas sp. MWU13-3659]|uniref:RHS repeat-associated core domain-containing protein n=1 Tax=Pseudomonas sp. MWU13-3659 TaxID=2986964 RepID=UPI0020758BDE|nr:RHS repeat-associated core domain-containing protein [Pseudomonas sp. MWU13-3659]